MLWNKKNILVIKEIPRVVTIQYRANIPGSSAQEYYKNNITILMLDRLSACMNSRFNEKTELVYKAFAILPNYIINSVMDGKGMHWRENVMEFANFYKDDLSNYNLLDAEHHNLPHILGNFQEISSHGKKYHLLLLRH